MITVSLPQTPPLQPPIQATTPDQMRVIAAVGAIAERYRKGATATPQSDIDPGLHTPFDLAITFQQTTAGYGWQVTIYRQEGTNDIRHVCDITCAPGSDAVDATWAPDSGPHLTALAYDLDMRLWSRGKGAA